MIPKTRNAAIFLSFMVGAVVLMAIMAIMLRQSPQLTIAKPAAQTSAHPTANAIRYTTIAAPCAVDEGSAHSVIAAIRDKDMEAINGLKDRGKVLALSAGTKFEPSGTAPEGFAWGFVRSGRQVGRDCYIPEAWLRPAKP